MKRAINNKIALEKDNRESNVLKDKEGKIIGYRQSEFTCNVYFENGEICWTPSNPSLSQILRFICKNEDYKYPNGMGRNMIFYAYIYPLFKEHLEKNGFRVGQHTLNFVKKETIKVDMEYEDFLKEVENDNKKS